MRNMPKELNQVTIGILGGIGPESSAEFYHNLIKGIQKRFKIESTNDFPHIILNSIAIQDMIDPNIRNSEINPILKGLVELDQFKPDFNAIICNSANSFHDYLSKNTATEILNLRTIILKHIRNKQLKKIGVLGTFTTQNNLYNYPNMEVITLPHDLCKCINDIILKINKGEHICASELDESVNYLVSQGAEEVILGCTEIELIGKNIPNTINPMVLLLEEVLCRISFLVEKKTV
jgi:aspartate racemase